MFSSLLLLSLAAVAPLAYATVAINQPVSSTVWTAGQPQSVTWIDSGTSPTLQQFGNASFELCVGTESIQVTVQNMGSADVSQANSQPFTPDANSLPPSYNQYFIKVTSTNLLDNSSTAVAGAHVMAFSARFTINGGKGQFSSAAQAVIGGNSTNTTTGLTSSTTPAANAAGATTHSSTSTSSASRAGNTTTAKNSSNSNGVGHMVVPHVLSATGVAAVVFVFAFFF
ncbi:hypothetical protein BC826DRAFT_988825 [Russula brevipes]|nr:hypothetical protein BC826DRAFT_988825 [Russula brevipes]